MSAQETSHFIQTGVSANAYKGDLQSAYDKWTSSFHLGLKFNKKKRINGQVNLGFGSITGQSTVSDFNLEGNEKAIPNKYFLTRYFTLQYDLNYNIVKNTQWTVYISQGAGIIRYNPKDENKNNLQDANDTRATNESYSNISIMLPTQLGVIHHLKNNFGLGIQTGFLNTMTDYLDNISDLGNRSGNDNVFLFRFSLYMPVAYKN